MPRRGGDEHDTIEDLMQSVTQSVEAEIINKVLLEDIAPLVEEMLLEHIQKDIYDAYTPVEGGWIGRRTYPRRYSLLDRSNLRSWILEDGVLAVTSTAVPDGPVFTKHGAMFRNMENGGFLAMHEKGNMGFWSQIKGRLKRPALSRTQRDVDRSLQYGDIKRVIDQRVKQLSK